GEAEEQVVLEGGAGVVGVGGLALAELRAAERVVGEKAAVERELEAALAARDDQAGVVDQLAAPEAGAELRPHVTLARDGEARAVVAPLEHDAIAERDLDGLAADLEPAALLLGTVDEPGEELASEEALGVDDGEEVLRHGRAPLPSSARRGTA